jgi:hypothetical protein
MFKGQTNQDMSRRNSRKGYMGHLFSMANFVTTRMSAPIEILLREADLWTPWEDFVAGKLIIGSFSLETNGFSNIFCLEKNQ